MDLSILHMQMGSAPPLSYKLYETDVILLTQHKEVAPFV